MKLSTLTMIVSIGAILVLGTACQTATTAGSNANPRKETLLAQSGFKLKTLTTDKQQQVVDTLPHGKVSAVTYQKKLYYVYPTSTKNQIYVGRQKQFDAYKQSLQAQSEPAAPAQGPAQGQAQTVGQQMMAGEPERTWATAGPRHIQVEEFDGFGPLADPYQ